MRKTKTHNEDERRLLIVSAPDRVDSWALPIDGGVERSALERIIVEMVAKRALKRSMPMTDVLRDSAVTHAYSSLSSRKELKPALDKALTAVKKYGF